MRRSEPKLRRFLGRYAGLRLVPLSVLVALMLAEGVLRQFPRLMPEGSQLRLMWRQQATATSVGDSYLGYVYHAHMQVDFGTGPARFSVVSDEHGFRNASPWPERARIVVVGDSMTYGWGVTAEES